MEADLPIDNLALTDNLQQIVQELKAQCPPGKEVEFENLISKIVVIPPKELIDTEENERAEEENNEQNQQENNEEDEQENKQEGEEENKEECKDNESSECEANESSGCDANDSVDPVEEDLMAYAKEFYPFGAKLSYTPSEVSLSALKLNPSNFWGVSWQSHWQQQQEQWNGSVKVTSHFYEDGNVQLHATCSFTGTGPLKAFIQRSEDSLQMSLNEAYQQLADVSFKRLRRQLPITRQKMDWNKYVNYKLSTELKN